MISGFTGSGLKIIILNRRILNKRAKALLIYMRAPGGTGDINLEYDRV